MKHYESINTVAINAPVSVAVIVVAYNSQAVMQWCLDALANQHRKPDTVIVIDNKSCDSAYLNEVGTRGDLAIRIIFNSTNLGFCAANNIGFLAARDHTYVIFLNPDAFLHQDFIQRAIDWMERPENADVGALSGTLLGFDVRLRQRTGLIDSTGIFQTWYGKWYDRGQGRKFTEMFVPAGEENVPAITGALMFCRARAVERIRSVDGHVFDGRFFMYKEDIDLSLRLRNAGWRVVYCPTLFCDHCRGWRNRRSMTARARYMSARNELRVCFANNCRGLLYSTLKFLSLPLEEIFIKLLRLCGHFAPKL